MHGVLLKRELRPLDWRRLTTTTGDLFDSRENLSKIIISYDIVGLYLGIPKLKRIQNRNDDHMHWRRMLPTNIYDPRATHLLLLRLQANNSAYLLVLRVSGRRYISGGCAATDCSGEKGTNKSKRGQRAMLKTGSHIYLRWWSSIRMLDSILLPVHVVHMYGSTYYSAKNTSSSFTLDSCISPQTSQDSTISSQYSNSTYFIHYKPPTSLATSL